MTRILTGSLLLVCGLAMGSLRADIPADNVQVPEQVPADSQPDSSAPEQEQKPRLVLKLLLETPSENTSGSHTGSISPYYPGDGGRIPSQSTRSTLVPVTEYEQKEINGKIVSVPRIVLRRVPVPTLLMEIECFDANVQSSLTEGGDPRHELKIDGPFLLTTPNGTIIEGTGLKLQDGRLIFDQVTMQSVDGEFQLQSGSMEVLLTDIMVQRKSALQAAPQEGTPLDVLAPQPDRENRRR